MALSTDQWPDSLQNTTISSSSVMTKSNPTRSKGQEPESLTNFDSLLNGTSTDPFFDNSLFTSNDYLLSDFEGFQNLGGDSTSESSPEPTSGVFAPGPIIFPVTASSSTSQTPASTSIGSDQSPVMATVQQSLQRAQTLSNPTYEAMFPNSLETGFVEDLTFQNRANSQNSPGKSDADASTSTETTTTKRSKGKSDVISACWTSPLCPNHDQDGPPPNPSTCGGGCAPFLFASDSGLSSSARHTNILSEPQELIAEDGIVEIQPRSRKRTDSDTSSEKVSGRQFPNKNSADVPTRTRSEASEDSPEQTTPQTNDDGKPKSRRRLPHNQVERKYRESLNTQLESLRRVVPSLQNQRGCKDADIEDLPTPSKPSKAVILASATAHIKQMEKDKKNLEEENQLLKQRVKALQALVKCDDCSLMQYVMDLRIQQQK